MPEGLRVESLYFLIPLSLLFLIVAVALFFWAVNSGQYEDIDREGERILFDDELRDPPAEKPPTDEQTSLGATDD